MDRVVIERACSGLMCVPTEGDPGEILIAVAKELGLKPTAVRGWYDDCIGMNDEGYYKLRETGFGRNPYSGVIWEDK
jgi:hypothetical protein